MTAAHISVRRRSARGGVKRLATTTPSIMSATTAAHGRPRTATATETAPPAKRRTLRSTPTSRGGERNEGATWP